MLGFGAVLVYAACTDFNGLIVPDSPDSSTPTGVDARATSETMPTGDVQQKPVDAASSDASPGGGDAAARGDGAVDAAALCSGSHLHFDPSSGHCYKYVGSKFDWSTAELDCRTWGGHLVSILNGAELTFVVDFVDVEQATVDAGTGIWIGLYRDPSGTEPLDAGYAWVSGEAAVFFDWGAKSPTGKPCVFQYGPGLQNHWDDYMCSVNAAYVCKRG